MNRPQGIEEKIEPPKEQAEQPQAKIMINLNDDTKPSKENNNPYAQLQDAPKR